MGSSTEKRRKNGTGQGFILLSIGILGPHYPIYSYPHLQARGHTTTTFVSGVRVMLCSYDWFCHSSLLLPPGVYNSVIA